MTASNIKSHLKAIQSLYSAPMTTQAYPLKLDDLPLWMKGVVEFYIITLSNDFHIHLLSPKATLPFEQLMRIHESLTKKLNSQILIIADKLPAKYRPLLVKFRIPFVYKDQSIFAPELGLKFRKLDKLITEPVLEVNENKSLLAPFGLKVIAGILTNQLPMSFTLKTLFNSFRQMNVKLSLSKLSQTLNLLANNHLIFSKGMGPQKSYSSDKKVIWNTLSDLEVSPLFREVLTNYIPIDRKSYVVAGESALSHYSNIAEPKQKAIAMLANDYRSMYQKKKNTIASVDFGTTSIVQIWKADPRIFAIDGAINPIELFFSLRHHTDERIQKSLDEMLQQYGLKRKE